MKSGKLCIKIRQSSCDQLKDAMLNFTTRQPIIDKINLTLQYIK